MVLTAAVLLITAGVGCNGGGTTWDDPGPTTTFERYLMHWFKGEQEKAFEKIRPSDREQLTESLAVVEEKVGSEVLDRHEMLVAGRVDNPYDLKDIEVEPKLETKPEPDQRVNLSLKYHDGRSGEATMVWGGDRWYVDLPLEHEAQSQTAGGESGEGEATDEKTSEKAAESAGPSPDASGSSDATSGDSRE